MNSAQTKKLSILLNGTEIGEDCNNLTITESIFSKYVTASFKLNDRKNIIKDKQIIGGEIVEILFETNTDKLTKYFVIDRITPDIQGYQKTIITINCISPYTVLADESLIKAFSGNLETIFRDIVKKNLQTKVYKTDRTIWDYSFNCNNWTIDKLLAFIEQRASTNDGSDFVLFESIDGFNLRSLSKMMALKSTENLVPSISTEKPKKDTIYSEISIDSNASFREANALGARGNVFTTLDLLNRDYNSAPVTYKGKNTNKLDTMNHANFRFVHSERTDYSMDFLPEKAMTTYDYATHQVSVSVDGTLKRKLGMKVSIHAVSNTPQNGRKDSYKEDKYISRDYLIATIVHNFGDKYTQSIKLITTTFKS